MSVKDDVLASATRNVEVTRLEWMTVLRQVPVQKEPEINQMVLDLLQGSERTAADRVFVERWQARKVCELAGLIEVQPAATTTKTDEEHSPE